MSRALGVALLIVGIMLLIFGFQESESLASEISEAFTGSPTERTIWLLIGGIICTVVGVFMTVRGRHTP